MNAFVRRWRMLALAERVLRVLRVFVLLRASLSVVSAAAKLWKRKGR